MCRSIMSFFDCIFKVVLPIHIERAWWNKTPFSFLVLLVQEPVVLAYSFLSFWSVIELAPHGAYLDACDIGVPHSIIFVNLSNEIEVRVIFGAVIKIEEYLCHIGCWHDSIAEVWVCLAFCLACWCIVSLAFAEVAPTSGSGCRRNWSLLLCLRVLNGVVLLVRCMMLLVYKFHSCHISHRISGV